MALQPPPERTRPPRFKRWSPQMDEKYLQSTWRFQRGLVRLVMVPAPFALAYLLCWHGSGQKGFAPLWVWAVLLGSIAFTLALAFFYWRCPACGFLLYRTSASGAPVLFWLSDPRACPDCGAPLQPAERPTRF